MQVSATLPSLPRPSCSCPPHFLPFVLLRAPLRLCVVDTSWHVVKSPGHLSALLSCTLYSRTDNSLVVRGLLLPACHFSRCLTAKGRNQPGSPHRLVSAEHHLMCSFHQPETAAKEDANNHLRNKNILLMLVKYKLQFQ